MVNIVIPTSQAQAEEIAAAHTSASAGLEGTSYDAAGIIYNDRLAAQRATTQAPAPVEQEPSTPPSTDDRGVGQQALTRIEQVPEPVVDDLQGMNFDVAGVLYNDRIKAQHEQRANIARTALDTMAPKPEDFAHLPDSVAGNAYEDAVDKFNNDPQAIELQRINEESGALASGLPASYGATDGSAPVAFFDPQTQTVANTPREVVRIIANLEPPSGADLQSLPYDAAGILYNDRIHSFNAQRAQLATDALEQMSPKREDFAHLPPAVAEIEYNSALQNFYNNPAVGELNRLRDEALTAPGALPQNPATVEGNTLNIDGMSEPDQRALLATLGIDMPVDPSPADWATAREVLMALPEDIIAQIINPGMEIVYETPNAGASTPSIDGVKVGGSIVTSGAVELSDVQMGADFSETQRLTFEVETRAEGGFSYGQRSQLQKLYGYYERLADSGRISDAAQQLVNSSPILRRVVGAQGRLPISVSAEAFGGARLTFETALTPEQGARVADGDLAAVPNPLDPLGMEEGNSILIRGEALRGTRFEATYKLFTVNDTVTELSGMGFGVERLGDDRVRIVSGPVENIENEFFVGFKKFGLSAGLGSERQLGSQNFQVAEIDVSTAEGRAAYQSFLSTGRIPDGSVDGVERAGRSQAMNYSETGRAEANLGPLNIRAGFTDNAYDQSRVEYGDGTVEYDTVVRLDDLTLDYKFTTDANGEVIDDQTVYQYILPDNDAALTTSLDTGFNPTGDKVFTQNQHVQLTFTHAELNELRALAMERVEARSDGTPEGVQAILDTPSDLIDNLAGTDNADEAANVLLLNHAGFDEAFATLGLEQGAIPGRMEVRPADS